MPTASLDVNVLPIGGSVTEHTKFLGIVQLHRHFSGTLFAFQNDLVAASVQLDNRRALPVHCSTCADQFTLKRHLI
jgi:hypothetical protein